MEVCAMGSQERHLQERVVDETAYIELHLYTYAGTPVHTDAYNTGTH